MVEAADGHGRRGTLTTAVVVAAAVELADEQGLDALTMRALGERLGVKAMSLYNHIENKESLLDGMVDQVYGEIALPEGDGWRAAVRHRAVSLRDALLRHPWAIGMLDTRLTPGPHNLRHHDAMLGVLHDAGFPLGEATFAYSVMDAFVYGFALQESAVPLSTADEQAEVYAGVMEGIDAGEYPHLHAAATELQATGYDYSTQFGDGLDLVLDGIERRLAAC